MTNFELLPLNCTPIVKTKSDLIIDKKEIDFLKNKVKYRKHKNNFLMSDTDSLLECDELKKIKEFIIKTFNKFTKEVLEINDNFKMISSWSTKHNNKTIHSKHFHPNVMFSLVFYLNVNSTINFYIEKSSISKAFNMDYSVKRWNFLNSSIWKLQVNSGDIVIFPGDLVHESSNHIGEDEKILIGANFFISGEIGDKKEFTYLNIK